MAFDDKPKPAYVDRRVVPHDLDRPYGRRASDVPIVTNGEVALLTLDGFIETASCLAKIVLCLDERDRARDTA